MSLPIRYSPMAFYFRLSIIFFTPQILWHAPHWCNPLRPSAWPPPTIPYTHCTISPVPHRRPSIWPTDHNVIFSFLSFFPFTWCILSWPDWSQVVALCNQDLTIRFTTHEPCAHLTYRLYLFCIYSEKEGSFPQNSDLSLSHLIVSLRSVSHLCSISYSRHTSPYHTVLNLHLTPLCTPWYYIRRPFHCSQIAPLRTT